MIALEEHDNFINFDFDNLVKWSKIISMLKDVLIEHGPPISSSQNYYPHDENNSYFNNKWFYRILPMVNKFQHNGQCIVFKKITFFSMYFILYYKYCAFVLHFDN